MSEDRRGRAEACDAIGQHDEDTFPHQEPTARRLTGSGRTLLRTDLAAGMLDLAGKNVPAAGFRQSMARADPDDAAIPFLGQPIRVSGYLVDESRGGPDPEHQVFPHCRRG
ncbi:hypothetical protein AB0C93_08100 [Streptomyces sp. NPDC048518]|uniref:hypothetical protein n=1 Tax=Streptomyces sp. NPDC048518 TaxID=3155029 RepID=UPI0033EA7675